MKKNILVVGIYGTLGRALLNFYSENELVTVYGTTSRREAVSDTIVYLDLESNESINSFKPLTTFDHVIVASGYEPQFNLQNTNAHHILKMFAIHVIGPMLFLKNVYAYLQKGGSIVFISSPAAYKGSYDPAYATVKGAVNSLIKTLAKDFAGHLRVNALAPSLIVDSPVFERMTPDFREKHLRNTLTGMHTTAFQCAESINFILFNDQLTGQIIHLNGGMIFGD